jgi:hypothetical protein
MMEMAKNRMRDFSGVVEAGLVFGEVVAVVGT